MDGICKRLGRFFSILLSAGGRCIPTTSFMPCRICMKCVTKTEGLLADISTKNYEKDRREIFHDLQKELQTMLRFLYSCNLLRDNSTDAMLCGI
jgi:hypothetical protein